MANKMLPHVGVGAVVFRGDAVLLVLRGRSPNQGEWAIPGGKIRWCETLQAAAEREVLEETGERIRGRLRTRREGQLLPTLRGHRPRGRIPRRRTQARRRRPGRTLGDSGG